MVGDAATDQRVELQLLLVLLLQKANHFVVLADCAFDLVLEDRALDALEDGLALVENEAGNGREEQDHGEDAVGAVLGVHEAHLLLAVLLDLLLRKFGDVDGDFTVEEAEGGCVGVGVLLHQFVFLLEGLLGLWEHNHLCAVR